MLLAYYLIVSNFLFFLGLLYTLYMVMRGQVTIKFHGVSSSRDEISEQHEDELVNLDAQLTPLEQERLQEMMEFDARIAMLKEEVANILPDARRESPNVAKEYDGVQNLPHNAVYIRSKHMDEVAE